MDADRLRRAIDQLIYLPSLRQGSSAGPSPALAAVAAAAKERQRRQGGGGGGGGGAGGAAGSNPVPPPPRPWDRAGLFRRAATFKPSTWFAKDAETAGPLRAAARGWTNVGVDLLRCEFCGEKLAATTSTTTATATTATGGSENDNNENEKTSFPARLVSCHAAECPWRTGPACDLESLAQFPPLTREAAQAEFAAREASALALDALPPLSRASYDSPASVAKGRLEALLQLGPRPEGGGEDEDEEEVEDAPEPPVLLLAAAPEGEGDGSSASTCPLVARRGSRLHLRMARLVALFGWSAEIVAPAVARRALEELAAAERRRMKAAVEEAAARRSRKERGGGGNGGGGAGGDDAAASATTTDNDGDELPSLWPPRVPPAHPPASAMPAGNTVRACDAALRCEACGATAGLWSFVPSELCGGGEGGGGSEGEEKGGGGAAATAADDGNGNDSTTPPAAKRARRGGDPSLPLLSGWSPSSPPGKASTATPGGGGEALPSRPGELDLISLHRSWCPFVDPPLLGGEKGEKERNRRRRVGWRWTLAALVPAVAGDDEAGEGDARLLGLEEDDGEEEVNEGGGAKKAGVATAANAANAAAATASSPPSSERATDRLRAVLARAGIVSPAAATTVPPPPPSSRSLVN